MMPSARRVKVVDFAIDVGRVEHGNGAWLMTPIIVMGEVQDS
jgi:hypothetical protein